METLVPGRCVGRYRVLRRLAVGGMAEIYLAQARGIEGFAKYVVLKRILPQFAASESFVNLFLNEARVTAAIDHPNVASVYDIGAIDGVYFFAMEYLHGEHLGHILRNAARNQERIPLQHALTIAVGVAAGLHAAHEKRAPDGKPLGIVHRDVSPSNVVVTYDGSVKLVDFGVAKLTAEVDLSRTGSLKGKIAYMSPEQCNNDRIDRRSDIFALGVLLYEITTQTRLFRGQSEAATLKLILDAAVPPPSSRLPGYPPELETIVLRALARDRDRRHGSARELQLALEGVARSQGLITSSAALGEWMTATLGTKPEPWLTPEVAALVEEGSRKHERPVHGRPTDGQGVTVVEPAIVPTEGGRRPPPADTAARRRPPMAVLSLAAILVVASAAAGIVAAGLGRNGRPDPPAAAAQEAGGPGAGAGAPAVVPMPPASPPPPAAAPSRSAELSAAATAPRPAPRRAAGSTGSAAAARRPRPEGFSDVFARKGPELLRCYSSFSEAPGHAPEISVRFQVATDGAVTAAEVLPPEVAATGLGKCIAKVAGSSQFGPQKTPVTVRIPVTLRRVGRAAEP